MAVSERSAGEEGRRGGRRGTWERPKVVDGEGIRRFLKRWIFSTVAGPRIGTVVPCTLNPPSMSIGSGEEEKTTKNATPVRKKDKKNKQNLS